MPNHCDILTIHIAISKIYLFKHKPTGFFFIMQVNPFVVNISQESLRNNDFRKVIFTGKNLQIVLMSLKPDEVIDMEIHGTHDQWIEIRDGTAVVTIGGKKTQKYILNHGEGISIPAGTWHQVQNKSHKKRLSLSTIYAPPEHPRYTVEHDKPEKELIIPTFHNV